MRSTAMATMALVLAMRGSLAWADAPQEPPFSAAQQQSLAEFQRLQAEARRIQQRCGSEADCIATQLQPPHPGHPTTIRTHWGSPARLNYEAAQHRWSIVYGTLLRSSCEMLKEVVERSGAADVDQASDCEDEANPGFLAPEVVFPLEDSPHVP